TIMKQGDSSTTNQIISATTQPGLHSGWRGWVFGASISVSCRCRCTIVTSCFRLLQTASASGHQRHSSHEQTTGLHLEPCSGCAAVSPAGPLPDQVGPLPGAESSAVFPHRCPDANFDQCWCR